MKRAVTDEVIARFSVEGDAMVKLEELIGAAVIHGSYGRGVILECKDSHVKVEFTHLNKVCTFLYPECFVKYLAFERQNIQEEMQVYLTTWKAESGYAEKEKMQKQYQDVFDGIMARRKAAEDKKHFSAERAAANRNNSNGKSETLSTETR